MKAVNSFVKILNKLEASYKVHEASTGSVYVEGYLNGIPFKVRFSDHAPCYPSRCIMFIDAFEDGLTPKEIIEEIKKGKASSYWVGREWVEEQERQNRMWIDDDEEKRKREKNKKRYEEYLKLWEDEELVRKIQALKNRQEIRAFAKENRLGVKDTFCIWRGIKRMKTYLNAKI